MEALAEAAGIPVRTVRFYRERKLIPPPRREGRIAWYNEAHLARLHTIAALLERGHTLGGIAELIGAWENGRTLDGVAELLGLEGALISPWSEETPVRLTPEALADYFGEDVTPENLTTALDIGYIAVDGENVVHTSRRLLDASAALVREGVPLAAVLETGRAVRIQVDALADLFTVLIRKHVVDAATVDHLPPGEVTRLAEALERLHPLAKNVVDAELSLAMDRRVRTELESWLQDHAAPGAAPGPNPPEGPSEDPAEDPATPAP
ncbi:MerR family transcriptional regulator [Streptomyces sp. RKAG293]|uniref:MerR family transcriptional regulator n=1 Tax=Streptomyces sp. RKAG293 TaxID=2893403 RepID=UPI002033D977|nr:MerR family transcriptional regulator [Streptomyces sp. RKAG293]MCM2419828.1 MerR family transcriptional regulator [Streptomyces sp. RKAG293]